MKENEIVDQATDIIKEKGTPDKVFSGNDELTEKLNAKCKGLNVQTNPASRQGNRLLLVYGTVNISLPQRKKEVPAPEPIPERIPDVGKTKKEKKK